METRKRILIVLLLVAFLPVPFASTLFHPLVFAQPTNTFYYQGTPTSVAPATIGAAYVTCPAGMVATGGGDDTSFISSTLFVASSEPTSNPPTGWGVVAYNPTVVAVKLYAAVVCSSTTTSAYAGTVVSVAPGTIGIADVACPAGMDATGGGEGDSSAPDTAATSDSFPTPIPFSQGETPTGWRAIAYNPATVSMNLEAFVVCSSSLTTSAYEGAVVSVAASHFSFPFVIGKGYASVACPAGMVATGGGDGTSEPPSLALFNSYPGPSVVVGGTPTGWEADAYNPNSVALNLVAFVVCSPTSSTTSTTSTTSSTSSTSSTSTVSLSGLGGAISGIYSSTSTLGFEETANVYDNSGAGYMIGPRSLTEVVFLFTDATEVNQATGELLFSPDYSNAVVVGGRAANPTTAFYENNGFAPLTAQLSGGNLLFFQGSSQVYMVSLASLSATNDYFVAEAFMDGTDTVVVLWGINAPGTLASGVYFHTQVFPNPSNFPASAYIIHWQGTTPNVPLPTDTYTIVYHT